jgi:hypothetical protein
MWTHTCCRWGEQPLLLPLLLLMPAMLPEMLLLLLLLAVLPACCHWLWLVSAQAGSGALRPYL